MKKRLGNEGITRRVTGQSFGAILNRVRVSVCVCSLNRVKDRVAPKLLPLLGGAYRRVEHTIDAKSCNRAMCS